MLSSCVLLAKFQKTANWHIGAVFHSIWLLVDQITKSAFPFSTVRLDYMFVINSDTCQFSATYLNLKAKELKLQELIIEKLNSFVTKLVIPSITQCEVVAGINSGQGLYAEKVSRKQKTLSIQNFCTKKNWKVLFSVNVLLYQISTLSLSV